MSKLDLDHIFFYRTQYPKLCNGVSSTIGKGENKEWLKERCKHNKFLSKNEKLCAELDTINNEDPETDDIDSDYEITTTPFTTPTTTNFTEEEQAEVTTETESVST